MAEKPTREELLRIEGLLKEIERRKREFALKDYHPYPKQTEFHAYGETRRERLFMAANRIGKTHCGAAEMAYHLTGLYPDDWKGRKFERPIKAWAASDTGLSTRDIVQAKLMGEPGVAAAFGTGLLPKACIGDTSLARGITDLYDTIQVKHHTNEKFDGWSVVSLKSYEQGRQKWQGTAIDVVWLDEEPPQDIYSEAVTRIAPTSAGARSGIIYMTFTPLKGMSDVVLSFLDQSKQSPDRSVTTSTIDDAVHIDPAERTKIIAGYAEHEREARALGIPSLGGGKIFPYAESRLAVEPFRVPDHWSLIWGIDFGVDHPFAAVLKAWDKDTDTLYTIHTIRMKDALPLQHAAAMKAWGEGAGARIPVAWPQDGHQRREYGGVLTPMRAIYKKHGLAMLDHHATFVDGSNSTELGILEMQERMTTNRFKVFTTLMEWWEEFRLYRRDEGQIVKVHDDLMSADRTATVARRFARSVLFQMTQEREESRMAKDVDIDPWS